MVEEKGQERTRKRMEGGGVARAGEELLGV